ncbi:MAG: hypothetical protein HY820_32505 [Acidobacteria bacterium]|nr:hypothetical protein [Acidobacteriota bacterium]
MKPPFQATIALSSVESQWLSPSVLPELPLPGTKSFATVLKVLSPYGPDASRITVETPSNRLSDVEVRFGLRGGNIQASLLYSGFRIQVAPFENAYEKDLRELSARLFDAISSPDLLPPGGRFQIRFQCHLTLSGATADDYLSERVSGSSMKPEGCSYQFVPPATSGLQIARVIFEKSSRVPAGLYVSCNMEFDALLPLDELTTKALEAIGYAIITGGIAL